MSTGDIRHIVVMNQVVTTHAAQFRVRESQNQFPTLIHRNKAEVEFVLGLEHVLLLGQFEQTWRPERRTVGEQGQWGLLGFSVLAMQNFHSTPNVQTLSTKQAKNKAETV